MATMSNLRTALADAIHRTQIVQAAARAAGVTARGEDEAEGATEEALDNTLGERPSFAG